MPKRKKLSSEEIAAQALVRELTDLKERDQFIPDPPPHMTFKVGDRVQHGAIEKSIIIEVIDNGRIYKLHENWIEHRYTELIPSERDMYVSWIDITTWRSKEENSKIDQFSERDPLYLSFCQMDMSSIFGKLYHFGIDLNPDYQRGNVWDENDKVKLIQSVFQNVDIGKFVFVHLPYKDDSPSYEVLDGKQRILALAAFYESRLKFAGRYYNDLCIRDQNHFEHYHVSVAHIQNADVKLSDKYRYFLRLNVSGKPQDPNHIKMVERLYKKAVAEGK